MKKRNICNINIKSSKAAKYNCNAFSSWISRNVRVRFPFARSIHNNNNNINHSSSKKSNKRLLLFIFEFFQCIVKFMLLFLFNHSFVAGLFDCLFNKVALMKPSMGVQFAISMFIPLFRMYSINEKSIGLWSLLYWHNVWSAPECRTFMM